MFRQALHAVACLSEHKIADKVGYLKKTFRWSDDEVDIAVCKTPLLLLRSKDTLQTKSEFLLSEVGLEPAYLAHWPVMLGDEVLPRQCPCRRAFDRGSVLGIRRTRRRSINDEGHTNFTQVHVPSVEDLYILLAI
jgi:hypothetical protein